ncbi:hypothetical protein ACWHLZ_10140 [Streptomyces chartreusis]|uniref:hypothetical protein n=1 Tax=Streptomyces chartreusis TaxID=1969 RepID=UPI0033CB5771|nr:hypothetical protein OG938_07495 [Streptomyces chartreusis]
MTGNPSLAEDLVALGLRPGATVLAHASLRRVGAGADAVLAAMRAVPGTEGTLVAQTFTAGYFRHHTGAPRAHLASEGQSSRGT